MQALSFKSVYPCYAAADCEIAERIAAFLERGADVRVLLEEGRMHSGEDLAEKAREARTADIALVLFSRNSMPSRWPRAQWEDALIHEPKAEGMRIGFVKCDDCVPPRVLTPMFEVKADSGGLRRIKRWVRGHETASRPQGSYSGDVEVLGIAIADRPGVEMTLSAADADEFVDAFQEDFDAVFRVPCLGRSLAAVAGDLGAQLGLRLEGDVESNVGRLREFCSERRFLFVLDGGRQLVIEGRCSTLIAPAPAAGPTGEPAESLREIQRVWDGQLARAPGDWSELCGLARLGRRLTRDAGRIAELYELMLQWHAGAQAQGDRRAMDEAACEIVWTLEGWGRMDEAAQWDYRRAAECDDQLPLPFGN